jgi:L-seryl-tRNA(Ser) seleniumtransferase
MKNVIVLLLFVVAFGIMFAGPASAQKTVAGEWDAQFNTPGGPQPLKLILKVDGEKLSGTAKRSRGDVALTGTVKGEDITFGYTIEYNGNAVTLTFTGKVKGDAMSGTVSFNDSASDDWSAKRAAAKP